MDLRELIEEVSIDTGCSKSIIGKILKSTFEICSRKIIEGAKVKLSGLATMSSEIRPAKKYFNVITREVTFSKARFVFKAIPSVKIKKKLSEKTAYTTKS